MTTEPDDVALEPAISRNEYHLIVGFGTFMCAVGLGALLGLQHVVTAPAFAIGLMLNRLFFGLLPTSLGPGMMIFCGLSMLLAGRLWRDLYVDPETGELVGEGEALRQIYDSEESNE